MARSPSKGRNSAGLNCADVQRGQIRWTNKTRGSQFGHVSVSMFIQNVLSKYDRGRSKSESISGTGVCIQPREKTPDAARG